MNFADLPDDSDTSDEDYVPVVKDEDVPSELDSDGNLEEPHSGSEELQNKGKKRKKTSEVKRKLKKDPRESGGSKENEQEQHLENKEAKQNVDDIWADFMKDTGFKPKNSRIDSKNTDNAKPKTNSTNTINRDSSVAMPTTQKPTEKVKITQIFEFAGEEVKIEKEVAANSAEARLLNQTPHGEGAKTSKGKRSGGLSGISNVLSQLGKKPKISTLEKTKLDWDKFKKEENIDEELQTYNKGKDGFLERQDFLQRADLRRFEIEKDLRAVERNKRFNSTL